MWWAPLPSAVSPFDGSVTVLFTLSMQQFNCTPWCITKVKSNAKLNKSFTYGQFQTHLKSRLANSWHSCNPRTCLGWSLRMPSSLLFLWDSLRWPLFHPQASCHLLLLWSFESFWPRSVEMPHFSRCCIVQMNKPLCCTCSFPDSKIQNVIMLNYFLTWNEYLIRRTGWSF